MSSAPPAAQPAWPGLALAALLLGIGNLVSPALAAGADKQPADPLQAVGAPRTSIEAGTAASPAQHSATPSGNLEVPARKPTPSQARPPTPIATGSLAVAAAPSPLGDPLQPGGNGDASPLPQELHQVRDLISGAERVTLQEAILATLRHNPSLRGAFAEIQVAEWELTANQRRWQPTAAVEASPGTTLLGQVFSTTVASYPNNTTSSFATSTYNSSYRNYSNTSNASIGLSLSWSFFDPSRGPAIRSADQRLQAQKLTFNVVARSLVLDTQIAYHSLQETQALIQIYETIYRQNRRQLDLVRAQFSIGMTHIGDVEQKKTQLLNQLNQLLLLYRQLAQEASALATTMGREPSSVVLPSDASGRASGDWTLSQSDTIAEGLGLREEIKASLAQSQAARWEARRLVNTYLPVLALTGTAYGYRGQGVYNANVGQDSTPFFSRQYTSEAALGVGLRWDFLDGGIRNAQAHAADARAQALENQAEENRLSVTNQIRRSYASYVAARLGLPGAQQAYAAATKSVDVSTKRYEIGIGTMTELIQATQLLGESAQYLTSLRLIYNNAIAELYRYSAQWPADYSTDIRADLKALEAAGR